MQFNTRPLILPLRCGPEGIPSFCVVHPILKKYSIRLRKGPSLLRSVFPYRAMDLHAAGPSKCQNTFISYGSSRVIKISAAFLPVSTYIGAFGGLPLSTLEMLVAGGGDDVTAITCCSQHHIL